MADTQHRLRTYSSLLLLVRCHTLREAVQRHCSHASNSIFKHQGRPLYLCSSAFVAQSESTRLYRVSALALPLTTETIVQIFKKGQNVLFFFQLFSTRYSIAESGWARQHRKKSKFSSVENSDGFYLLVHRRRIRCCNLLRLSCGKSNSGVVFSLCHYMALIQMHTVYRTGYSPSSLCFLDSSCLLLWATTSSGTLSKSLVCMDGWMDG